MDRSFLSQPSVIAASRSFVCIRLATYENELEAAFLKSFRVTRSGEVENTVFSIMSPDGKQSLVRASRSARQTFSDAAAMADSMRRIAKNYESRAEGKPTMLPVVANVRLAIDVAACDNQPLVAIFAKDDAKRRVLESRIAALAWSEKFIGRFVYVSEDNEKDLAAIASEKKDEGIFVVKADTFGLNGTLLARADVASTDAEFEKCLTAGLSRFSKASKQHHSHVRTGHEKGIFWETVMPVTDPMENQARARGKREVSPPKR